MGYRCSCTVCRNNHKGRKSNLSGRALQGSHRSCFRDKPSYGTSWSDRQKKIIAGTQDGKIRKNEVTTIIRKAEQLEMFELAQQTYKRYAFLYRQNNTNDYTLDEANEILNSITPNDI